MSEVKWIIEKDMFDDPSLHKGVFASGRQVGICAIGIAQTETSFKIIEMNSFNCVGWYACDTETVIRETSDYFWKEFKETYG